jgi:hypothetical protein
MESDEERKMHRDARLRFVTCASSAAQMIRYVGNAMRTLFVNAKLLRVRGRFVRITTIIQANQLLGIAPR